MKVLHPYTLRDPERKRRTWAFVESLRRAGLLVYDREVGEDQDYWDFVASHWGNDDMIVLEDDKRPTTEQFKELVLCDGGRWCAFPYSFSMRVRTRLEDWTGERFPYGLGFVKFPLAAQLSLPVSEWVRPKSRAPGWCLDRSIEMPLIARVGLPHVHRSFVFHDHPATAKKVLASRGAEVLAKAGLRKGGPLD